jgi:hypothetical protein
MPEEKSDNSEPISIGRIPLKQVRVKRTESSNANPMNRLVPYLDLFCRLEDEELARLAGVAEEVCATLRKQVVAIDRGLARYVDLLSRLTDGELVRLTGATAKTIRFWRLCQPRVHRDEVPGDIFAGDGVVAKAATQKATTAPQPAATRQMTKAEPSPSESMTGGIVPDSGFGRSAAEDSGINPPPNRAASTQVSAKRFLQFSGEPFPGFEAPEEEPPMYADEIEIEDIGEDDLLDDPLRTL